MTLDELDVVDAALGHHGRLLSVYKETPPSREGHNLYWNACVFIKEPGRVGASGPAILGLRPSYRQIWYGDLDATEKHEALQGLARDLGATLYVTPENPFRFKGFKDGQKVRYAMERVLEYKP
jgi:hypothetical protein